MLTFVLAIFTLPHTAQAESSGYSPAFSDATDLIAGVNAVRSSQGLNALQPNSILMSIAQSQAEYELSIGSQTDTGPGGTRPTNALWQPATCSPGICPKAASWRNLSVQVLEQMHLM